MDVGSIVNILLPAVFILVGIALIWLLIELVRTLKSARSMVDDMQKHLTPTLAHIEEITGELKPAMERVDPLVERLSLTVDAANLELMRVDQILENVGDISGTVSNTTSAIDKVTQAPLKVVTSVSDRVRRVMGSSRGSNEAARLAEQAGSGSGMGGKHAAPSGDVVFEDIDVPEPAIDEVGGEEAPAEEKNYYTYSAGTAAGAAAVASVPEVNVTIDESLVPHEVPEPASIPESVAAPEAIAESEPVVEQPIEPTPDSAFEEQSTGEIPLVDDAPFASTPAHAAEPIEEAASVFAPAPEPTPVPEPVAAPAPEPAPAPAVADEIDFSSFFENNQTASPAVANEPSAEVAGLEGILDGIVVPEAPVAPVIVTEEAPVAPAVPDTVFVPASDFIATADPVEIVTEEDPAALADQLAGAFATPGEQATGPIASVAEAASVAPAPAPEAAPTATYSDDLSAVDAALAAARARIAAKIGGPSSGELFSVSAELPPEPPTDRANQ